MNFTHFHLDIWKPTLTQLTMTLTSGWTFIIVPWTSIALIYSVRYTDSAHLYLSTFGDHPRTIEIEGDNDSINRLMDHIQENWPIRH